MIIGELTQKKIEKKQVLFLINRIFWGKIF